MFIGHLPAGYLLASALRDRIQGLSSRHAALLLTAGLIGSVFPDLDWFYFWFVDHGRVHHHRYWTHLPLFWVCLLPWLLALANVLGGRLWSRAIMLFGAGALLHIVLDSIAGDIWWLYPWIDKPYSMVTVQGLYKPWWLNFFLHWTFQLELFVCAWALWHWRKRAAQHAGQGR